MIHKLLLAFLIVGGCEAVTLTLSTKFEDVESNSNVWATNLPFLTVNIVSSAFSVVGSGFFSVLHQDKDGNVIQTCQIEVTNTVCDPSSCSGVTCTRSTAGMVINYVFNDLDSSKNNSVISLPQNSLAPVAQPSAWIYENLIIYVQNCTLTSDGLQNVNLVDSGTSCDFNCSSKVSCESGYEPSEDDAVCFANATWVWDGVCELECNWSGVTIPSTLERAVGAPAEFYVSNNNTLYNSTVFTWKLTSSSSSSTTTVLAELVHFSGSPGTFVPLSTPKRGATVSSIATSSTSSYHNLTFTPNLSDNGSNITLERDGCSAETKTSRPTTLDLRYGDTEHFGSSFVADKTRVEYNTTVTFSCDPAHYEPASFTAVLLADATWEPSDAPVTCTLTTTTSMTTIIATTEATVTDTTTALSTEASNTQTSTVQQSTEITQTSALQNVSMKTSTVQQSTEIPQSSTHGNVSNNNASLSLVTSLPTTTETNSNTTGDGSAERQACDVNFFRNAAPVNLNGICVDGCSVYFRCNDVSIAQNINFTRSCGRNGAWNNTSSPCLVFCPGLKDGELAGIAFVIIYASITLVWVYLVFDRNKNIKIAIKKTVLLGVCKFICWIIGIGLLFGATEDWCDLTGGNIAGIVFGVIAVLLGILYCFLNHKQFFDETPISAGTRVSPAPVPQNGETAPEQMEMNPEDSL